MKATRTIPPEMFDNENDQVFKNDFFNRFNPTHPGHDIQLTDSVSRPYKFPTFYGDVTCSMGIFMCSYEKAKELVQQNLHHKVSPIKMTRGRALIAFSCYEYKNVMGVLPYNEIAVAIPVMVNGGFNPPILPMIFNGFNHFGYYIAAMPVTSYENQLRGNNIWGLPKVTHDIDMFSKDGTCTTEVFEESGESYLKLQLPTTGTPTAFDVGSNLYSKLNGKMLQSPTNFQSVFTVNKNMGLLFNKNKKSDIDYLTIGTSPSAKIYRDLEIEETPFQTRYTEGMSSCFDLPKANTPAWLNELNQ